MKNIKTINNCTSENRWEFYKKHFQLSENEKYDAENKPKTMIYICEYCDNASDSDDNEIPYSDTSYMFCPPIWEEDEGCEFYREHWTADIDNVEFETFNLYEALAYYYLKVLNFGTDELETVTRLFKQGKLTARPKNN